MRKVSWLLFVPLTLLVGLFPAHADRICSGWPDGTVCQPENPCMSPGRCEADNCKSNQAAAAGTSCGMPEGPCRGGKVCDGNGVCVAGTQLPVGTPCGDSGSPCRAPNICDATGQCVAGNSLPDGTVCRRTDNPCREDYVCRMGLCLSGNPRASMTPCASPQLCRGAGLCDGMGTCLSGSPIAENEGKTCIGNDVCQDFVCTNGNCLSRGARVCSADACIRSVCIADRGCTPPENICDMASPSDLEQPTTDLPETSSDGSMNTEDAAVMSSDLTGQGSEDASMAQDQSGSTPDGSLADGDGSHADGSLADGSVQDAAMFPADGGATDGGVNPVQGMRGPVYTLPSRLTGGACQCQAVGQAGGENGELLGLSLMMIAILVRRRRRNV